MPVKKLEKPTKRARKNFPESVPVKLKKMPVKKKCKIMPVKLYKIPL